MLKYFYDKKGIGLTVILIFLVVFFILIIIIAKNLLNPKPKKTTMSPQPILDLPRPPIKSKTPTQNNEEIPSNILW